MVAMMLNSFDRAGASLRRPWCSLVYVPEKGMINRRKKDFLSVYDLDFCAHALATLFASRAARRAACSMMVGIAVQTATGGTNT
jgi:hypothetical protein